MVGWIVHSDVNTVLDLAYTLGSLILVSQMVTELLIHVP